MTTAGAPTTLILAVTIMLYPLVAVFSPKAMVALLVLTAGTIACRRRARDQRVRY